MRGSRNPRDPQDIRHYALGVGQDIMVPVAQHDPAAGSEFGIARRIAYPAMLATIDLDGDTLGRAGEINDERWHGMLAPHLQSDAPCPQETPQQRLGLGRPAAEMAGACVVLREWHR